ncbi:MAG: hypothetical protein JWQ94_604, partial [Tardiphaga sp.]|nr:hypothetical protein [Tardiphaga sp.]
QADHLSRLVQVPDRHRIDRAGRGRRADGADGGAQAQARRRGPVRRVAKTIVAVAAGSDRRGDLADRRRHSRHPASARRPLSAPGTGVAGQGAGRGLRRTGRRRDPRLQRAARGRPDSAAGPSDRGARRWLAGRPVVVQRGDRGARRRREPDPADLRGRPRDRHHADRFRRRPARADADRRRRNGGAGARRTGSSRSRPTSAA